MRWWLEKMSDTFAVHTLLARLQRFYYNHEAGGYKNRNLAFSQAFLPLTRQWRVPYVRASLFDVEADHQELDYDVPYGDYTSGSFKVRADLDLEDFFYASLHELRHHMQECCITEVLAYRSNGRKVPPPHMPLKLEDKIVAAAQSRFNWMLDRRYLRRVVSTGLSHCPPSRAKIEWAEMLLESCTVSSPYRFELALVKTLRRRLQRAPSFRQEAASMRDDLVKVIFAGRGARLAQVEQLRVPLLRGLLIDKLRRKENRLERLIADTFEEQDATEYARDLLASYLTNDRASDSRREAVSVG
jgi:hypothetical protein